MSDEIKNLNEELMPMDGETSALDDAALEDVAGGAICGSFTCRTYSEN